MEPIKVIAGEDYPDLSGIPKATDTWNAHITKISDLGNVYVAGCVTPRINIMECNLVVFIGPNTTRDEIIKDWEAIKGIRNKLAAYQGSLPIRELPYRQTAYDLHTEFKLGYGEIAKLLNFEIIALVILGLGKVKEIGRVAPIEGYFDDFELLLSSFGLSDSEGKVLKQEAVKSLSEGNIPWNPFEYPVDQKIVREYIRSFTQLLTKNTMILDKKLTRSLRFLELGEVRQLIKEITLKAYPLEKRKIHRYLDKWNVLNIQMIRERVRNMKSYYVKPATLGDLDQFFP